MTSDPSRMPQDPSELPTYYYDTGRQRRRAQDRFWWDGEESHWQPKLRDLPKDHPDYPHGNTGYQYGCRCGECINGHNDYQADYRRRKGITKPDTKYQRGKSGPGTENSRKIGTRSCYMICHKRPEGAHPECAAANSRYVSDHNFLRGMTKRLPQPGGNTDAQQ